MKTNSKGVSLIVLIITVIVMLILGAVIILIISGNDIRGKANEAVSSNDISSAKEIVGLARTEWEMNYDKLKKTYKNFREYAYGKLEESEIRNVGISKDGIVKEEIYRDKEGYTAFIPEGFSVSKKDGEQTIENGLVIIDEEGNEFVWIPVDDINMFKRTKTYDGLNITELSDKNTEPSSLMTEGNDLTGEYEEYNAMKASVEKYEGFYIARYEAGLPEGKTTDTIITTDKPISKKGVTPWAYIKWGTSMTEIGTEGAVYRARLMYKDSKSVVSTLCYGVQWDSALRFISNRGIKDKNYAADSTGKGNFEKNAVKTGSSENYSLNNIYDMAGNVGEWTMEAYSTTTRIGRSGSANYPGDERPASHRRTNYPYDGGRLDGFRVALYIK